jgi:hypothetical protein
MLFEQITPRIETSEAYSMFIMNRGLYPLYLQFYLLYLEVTVRNVAVRSYTVTKAFYRNMYIIEYK